MVTDRENDIAKTTDNIVGYFTNVADAAEWAGMGLCVVIYTTDGVAPEVLATVHTGASDITDEPFA